MKYLLLVTILILASGLSAFADGDTVQVSGAAVIHEARTYMDSPEGTRYHLLLAPKTLLDSLGISIDNGAKVSVTGRLKARQILVSQIKISEESYDLRDASGKDLYPHHSDRKVDPDTCISCWLCIRNCPVGALSRRDGKAYIDPELCIDCGICSDGNGRFKGCPVEAIE